MGVAHTGVLRDSFGPCWDSHVSDPNVVKFRRNKSLTRDGIDAFWKSKKDKEEEHLKDISLLSPRSQVFNFFFLIFIPTTKILFEGGVDSETGLEKIIQKNGWWVSSNSAFLNEPPVIASDGTQQRYASQFHVTRTDGSSSNTPHGRTGVSA
ncbi:hypothetical protein DH2020_008075 [Rehmannia glutinosa]|uniref:Uncharacterized protein n=1 Tax=Rehmannia glutinosa TaxID=99300 RepID=A0ABR0TZX6_REHGL